MQGKFKDIVNIVFDNKDRKMLAVDKKGQVIIFKWKGDPSSNQLTKGKSGNLSET
jgi:hypothetical protein